VRRRCRSAGVRWNWRRSVNSLRSCRHATGSKCARVDARGLRRTRRVFDVVRATRAENEEDSGERTRRFTTLEQLSAGHSIRNIGAKFGGVDDQASASPARLAACLALSIYRRFAWAPSFPDARGTAFPSLVLAATPFVATPSMPAGRSPRTGATAVGRSGIMIRFRVVASKCS
jgi:hypothetical protein